MTLHDDNHNVAKIIKDLEDRIANLEQEDRDDSVPKVLRKVTDSITVGDSVQSVHTATLEGATWDSSTSGWDTSTWQ